MVQQNTPRRGAVDDFDRKILGILIKNSGTSYATLGESVGLSAPAVHERVKRLRKRGVIKQTTIAVDGAAIGKPFLAFVLVEFSGWGKSQKLMEIANFPEVEEIHSVAGDSGMILKIRTQDAHSLELFLARLYQFSGVRTTKSYIVLSTFLERPTQADITQEWPETLLPEG